MNQRRPLTADDHVIIANVAQVSERTYRLRVLLTGDGDGLDPRHGYAGSRRNQEVWFYEDRENGIITADVVKYEKWMRALEGGQDDE